MSYYYPAPGRTAVPMALPENCRVLDVGCGSGDKLQHPLFDAAAEICGIDVDAAAVNHGRACYPAVSFTVGVAEQLPYPEGYFDFVLSRVALPYTDLSRSLAEISRVLKAGGSVLLTMHDWRHEWRWLREAISQRQIRSVLRHLYVVAASIGYALTGRVLRCPWSHTRETFQTRRRLTRELIRAGFQRVFHERTDRDWIIRAVRQ